jgi:hypothetical protein
VRAQQDQQHDHGVDGEQDRARNPRPAPAATAEYRDDDPADETDGIGDDGDHGHACHLVRRALHQRAQVLLGVVGGLGVAAEDHEAGDERGRGSYEARVHEP